MAGTGARTIPSKAKKAKGTSKRTAPKTASSGIKHQVIMPKHAAAIASSKAKHSRKTTGGVAPSSSIVKMKTVSRPGRVSKRNGVWYLGGNHVVKLLTSVDGDLDHDLLAKLEAVPTVVGELALSVESLVSDDFTVGGFEKDILAKITSNTLTAKRGVVAATNAAATPTPLPAPTSVDQGKKNGQSTSTAAKETGTAPSPAPTGEGQVPNPLLGNYQPVPNPLAIRITPPASPHANSAEQKPAAIPKTRTDPPMIQAR